MKPLGKADLCKTDGFQEQVKDMVGKKNNQGRDEQLDRVGREIVRASAANAEEAERVAASPFLYARLRSRIASERAQREEGEGWLAMLGVVWRAIPAMALIAIFAFALFLSANFSALPSTGSNDEALLGTNDAGIESVVFADNRTLSSDDVLATILDEDGQEASK
jgi:hypothetical protein